jgi:transposase
MWPGNIADVTALLPVVKRMWEISEITIVADRGVASQATLEAFENSDRLRTAQSQGSLGTRASPCRLSK